jgi:hypothetical protein
MSRAFGEFDPRFLGVSLQVSSASRLDYLYRYSIGPDEITDSEAARLEDEEFLEQISCLTVLMHEFRHFHDHIISPLGTRLMHARCVLALNTAMLFARIRADQDAGSANVLPAPLSTWCRMPSAEREAFLAELDAVPHEGGRFRAPRLPFLSADGSVLREPGVPQASERVIEAVRACDGAQHALTELQALPEGVRPARLLDPSLIWEASAVLVQCQEIRKAVGDRAVSRFTRMLITEPRNRYGGALRAVRAVFRRANLPPDIVSLLQFTLWCLLGDPYRDGRFASPIIRYARLGDLLVENGSRAMGASAEDNYELWDRLTGSAPTLDSLSDSLGRNQLFQDRLLAKFPEAELTGETNVIAPVVKLLGQFIEARRYLVRRVQSDPDEYSSPLAYLSSIDRLPAPPIKIVMGSGGGIALPADFERFGWHLYAGQESDTDGMAGIIVGPPLEQKGLRQIDRETAFYAYAYFVLSDILFGPDIIDVPQSDWETAGLHLAGNEMRLVRINR